MAKYFIISDNLRGTLYTHLLKQVIAEKGNVTGHPNATVAYNNLNLPVEELPFNVVHTQEEKYIVDCEYKLGGTTYEEIKTEIEASSKNVHVHTSLLPHIDQLKTDYPGCTIAVVIRNGTELYLHALVYRTDNGIEAQLLLSNTIVDINDDGSVNVADSVDDVLEYDGTSVPWQTIDYFLA